MDIIITFFRDILNGPVYIVVAIICGILICSCIGYLAEKSIQKKKQKDKYVQIANPNTTSNYEQIPTVSTVPQTPVGNTSVATATPQTGQAVVPQSVKTQQVPPQQTSQPSPVQQQTAVAPQPQQVVSPTPTVATQNKN